MIPRWVERYIGIPFADEGYSLKGCHCWGIVYLVYLRERGIELPTYAEISWRDLHAVARTMLEDSARDPWHRAAVPAQAFDVVLMRGESYHAGVMVDGAHILHVERSTDSVCVPVSHPSIRHRVLASFRHKVLHEQAAVA